QREVLGIDLVMRERQPAEDGIRSERDEREERQRRGHVARSNRTTPPQGRFPSGGFGSGSLARSRMKELVRFFFAAGCCIERTAAGRHPCGRKKSGPCSGANRNGTPASSRRSPNCFVSIARSPGDTRSTIQCLNPGAADRSSASSPTC